MGFDFRLQDYLAGDLNTFVGHANNLIAEANALADEIAAKAPLAVAAIKEIATSTAVSSEQAAFALLRSGKLEHYQRMLHSDDSLEGARAFNEKRPPVWRGR